MTEMRVILKSSRVVAFAVAASLTAGACADGAAGDGDRPLVMVTTAILGDVVDELAGDDIDVDVLMPRGADPHSFEASARQAARLRGADLVVANGLGLEERLLDALASARDDGVPIVEIGPLVDPLPIGEGGRGHDEEHGDEAHEDGDEADHEHEGDFDPHVWMDPLRMEEAVAAIGSRLEELIPDVAWDERVDRYRAEIRATHDSIDELVAAVPPERRKLVTDHDSLAYFAARYGFEVVGTVVPGTSTLGAPSAGDLARLAELVRAEGVPAIFVESTQATRLADALADEVGVEIEVVTLFAGTLDEASAEAGTYLGMLVTDARRVAEALS